METMATTTKPSINIDLSRKQPPTRDHPDSAAAAAAAAATAAVKEHLPPAKSTKTHPVQQSSTALNSNNASLFFVGTATTILEWQGLRLMTDPNFLHRGDHVHLGPGVRGTRRTNPAVDLHDLPNIDLVLLSHYHADHFDQQVEASLRRDLPIITTPHAHHHLNNKGHGDSFTAVHALDAWEDMFVNFVGGGDGEPGPRRPSIHVTGMPGKHVGDGLLAKANDILGAVPPTNGWMLELGCSSSPPSPSSFECGYRIYISGDTLYVGDLERIPELYTHAGKPIDLMLIHLGGTTIPGPHMPLIMVTMDAKQGIQLVKLIQPDLTIPIHYDDYDVFLSPLDDFKAEITKAGLDNKVVYLDRGDRFDFQVRPPTPTESKITT